MSIGLFQFQNKVYTKIYKIAKKKYIKKKNVGMPYGFFKFIQSKSKQVLSPKMKNRNV